MKKILIAIVVIIVLGIAWWLLSPFWRNTRLDEALPQAIPQVKDNLNTMDEKTREQFENETDAMKDKAMVKEEAMPEAGPKILGQAPMAARAHDVEGQAVLVESGGRKFLRFENLKTINGPDLRIYLSAGLDNDDFIDLGAIRATEGNVNYAIPEGADLFKYKNALIWCRAFGVLFSYAEF